MGISNGTGGANVATVLALVAALGGDEGFFAGDSNGFGGANRFTFFASDATVSVHEFCQARRTAGYLLQGTKGAD